MRKNKEATKEYNKKYWAEHREEIAIKRQSSKDHRTEYAREWRKKNRGQYNAYMREYLRKRRQEKKQAELDKK